MHNKLCKSCDMFEDKCVWSALYPISNHSHIRQLQFATHVFSQQVLQQAVQISIRQWFTLVLKRARHSILRCRDQALRLCSARQKFKAFFVDIIVYTAKIAVPSKKKYACLKFGRAVPTTPSALPQLMEISIKMTITLGGGVSSWEICHRCAKILLAIEHKMQLA